MKRIMIFVMASMGILLSCGNSVNLENCQEYCSAMDNLGAFGTWKCYALQKKDTLNKCAEIIIVSTDDPIFVSSVDGDSDSEATEANTVVEQMCYRKELGSQTEDVNNEAYDWYKITNPLNSTDCLNQCEVNTQGDPIPEALKLPIKNASTVFDFLAAELMQKCVIKANES